MSEDELLVATSRRDFVLRRVMSLCGLVPLGAFVVAHLLAVAQSLRGPGAFASALSSPSRARWVAEALVIGVPLVVHAGIALTLSRGSRPNLARYPYSGNLAWVLQRASGVVVLGFLLAHVWATRVAVVLGHVSSADLPGKMTALLSSTGPLDFPFYATGYLLGVTATVYHLGNGVLGCAASFGLVRSQRGFELLRLGCAAAGAALLLTSVATVIHLATGTVLPWGNT
ncbi:MAG: hypothetical protein HYZ29_22045 [Myxococcales bacterium]|nr:hypothetical protein [Myxococcales bacterium]